jgi:hypothetical protein
LELWREHIKDEEIYSVSRNTLTRSKFINELWKAKLGEIAMSDLLNSFLASYSRETREIALSLRKLVLDVFPDAVEQIDPKSGKIAYGFDRTDKGLVCAIAPHMKHVNFMFSKGAQLLDSFKLLDGTGKQARHVKIRSEVETENLALRLLVQEAVKLGREH